MSLQAVIRSSRTALIQTSGLSPSSLLLRLTRSVQSAASSQQSSEYSFTKPKSNLHQIKPDGKINSFNDAMSYMNKVKDVMIETNPFFKLLNDNSIAPRVRMSFVPYMCGFSCGFADFVSNVLKVDNDDHILTDLEKKVNEYVAEDDFHYNFYLHDFEALGTKLEDFGSLQGAMRHVWCPEAAAGRRTIYALAETIGFHPDTRLRMLAAELVEAGLVGLFTTIYSGMIKADNDLPRLEYFGDTHVGLEAGHTVTAQFSGKDATADPENVWMSEPMTEEVAEACRKGIVLTMSSFDNMYSSFRHVIIATHEGRLEIKPKRFTARGDLPMANILGY